MLHRRRFTRCDAATNRAPLTTKGISLASSTADRPATIRAIPEARIRSPLHLRCSVKPQHRLPQRESCCRAETLLRTTPLKKTAVPKKGRTAINAGISTQWTAQIADNEAPTESSDACKNGELLFMLEPLFPRGQNSYRASARRKRDLRALLVANGNPHRQWRDKLIRQSDCSGSLPGPDYCELFAIIAQKLLRRARPTNPQEPDLMFDDPKSRQVAYLFFHPGEGAVLQILDLAARLTNEMVMMLLIRIG